MKSDSRASGDGAKTGKICQYAKSLILLVGEIRRECINFKSERIEKLEQK